MTCVVAMATDKGVMMGADSCAGLWHQAGVVRQPKVARVGEYLIGVCGSFRMLQLLHHGIDAAAHNPKQDIFAHLLHVFVPEVRTVFREAGFSLVENNSEAGGHFLVAHGQRIFHVQSDYSVLEYEDPYAAIGCGEEWAIGSLFAQREMRASTKEKLMTALEAATRYSSYVRPPYHFVANY